MLVLVIYKYKALPSRAQLLICTNSITRLFNCYYCMPYVAVKIRDQATVADVMRFCTGLDRLPP